MLIGSRKRQIITDDVMYRFAMLLPEKLSGLLFRSKQSHIQLPGIYPFEEISFKAR